MYFSRSVIASALMGFATAQSSIVASESLLASAASSASGSLSTGTPGAAGGMVVTHTIQVGGPNGSLAFFPNNVKANVGDMIQFQFHPKNHSVVQSTFDNPCVPIQNIMANKTDAFYSGYMPTNASFAATNQILTYSIRVNDARPIWFYCSQGKHCQNGMVGAINAPTSGNRTIESHIALAAQAPENLTPGQSTGSGSGSGSGSGNTPPSPSSGSGADAANPSGTGNSPAQATANVGSGISSQSFFGLGAFVAAAFALL